MTDQIPGDPIPGDASPLAHRIREVLRREHADCARGAEPSCHLAELWAEDIQEILDLAAQDAP